MDKPDLTPAMQELMAEMVAMRTELDNLKSRVSLLPQPEPKPPANPEVSTTRRSVLRRLAGGMLAGLAVGGVAAAPENAQASFVRSGGAGAILMPKGGIVTGNLPATTFYGLIATPDSTLNLGGFSAGYTAGVLGASSGGGNSIGVFGQSGNTGVYGDGNVYGLHGSTTGLYAVYGSGLGEALGVYGKGVNGVGVAGQSETNYGLQGHTNGTGSAGVKGDSSNSPGVVGESTNNYGLSGKSTYSYGVYGFSTNSAGLYGECSSASPGLNGKSYSGNGVYGSSTWGNGVSGVSTNGAGVYGSSSAYLAGQFVGAVSVTGYLYKTGGGFRIDHPLDAANHYLNHSFVESPDMMNIYNGIVTLDEQGKATIEMADWFEALNFDFRYQLTCLGQYSQVYIAEKLKDRKFKIAGGQPGQEISWMVTGIRQDAYAKAHRVPVEEDKKGDEKGKYLHPELFGQPEEMSVHPRPLAAK